MNKTQLSFVITLLALPLLGASCFTSAPSQNEQASSTQPEPVVQEELPVNPTPTEDLVSEPIVESDQDRQATDNSPQELPNTIDQEEGESEAEPLAEENSAQEEVSQIAPTGTVLSGGQTPVIAFNQADYEKALAANKTIVLTFYANWCPTCKKQEVGFLEAMQEINDPNVVAFRVNYRDTETDDAEEDLARKFGISVQHSKVILQNGQQVVKSPEFWEKDRYLQEVNNLL